MYLKIIGDPEAQVAEDEEGDNLSARLLVVVLLVNLLLLQVGDEEQLEVHLAISQLTKYTKHPKKASSASSLGQHCQEHLTANLTMYNFLKFNIFGYR